MSFPKLQRAGFEYNASGKVCKAIDPLGRETRYTYGTNNIADPVCTSGSSIDLLKVEQKNNLGGYDLVQEYTYNTQHQSLTMKDAAGQTMSYTYLTDGRLSTVVSPARNGPDGTTPLTQAERTTTYTYYAIPTPPAAIPFNAGRLQSVAGPSIGGTPGPSSAFTYEAFTSGGVYQKSVQTVTNQEAYSVTTDYDPMDRPTKITYPDGTFEETVYNRLDPAGHRDRLGRWTHRFYDALRRLVATRDPLGRTVTQKWCNCGSLDKLVDANGNATSWERDLQGRVKREIRADQSAKNIVYENTTSRLKQVTDALGQTIQYGYDLDDNLVTITYPNSITTPSVAFSYRIGGLPTTGTPEPYGRLTKMTDGTGDTLYTYHPAGVLGANNLKDIDGPLTDDTVSYGYDELGRVKARTVNGAANSETRAYDSLGRLSKQTNLLGASGFDYAYEGVTWRPGSVAYPNGQTTSYAYEPNLGDHRLKEIHHRRAGGATLSKFNYTTDAAANIKTWTQQFETQPASTLSFAYDFADQLASAVRTPADPALPDRFAYDYDKAGNRTTEQLDDAGTESVYNSMNRLTNQQAGGAITFKGMVNEPATVSVQDKPATVTPQGAGPTQTFEGKAKVAPGGTTNVAVQATDPSGNVRTNTYAMNVTAAPRTLSYDANGNLTGEGTRTFEWDAENRLTRVLNGGSEVARFVYTGGGRRYQKIVGGITRTYIYDGDHVAEERLSGGSTGTIRYFHGPGTDDWLGRQETDGSLTYFVADHIGNIAQHANSAGTVTLTRTYDPWGSLATSGSVSGPAFTGRDWDAETGLYYYRTRYYDPRLGRFLGEDPWGLGAGPNLYVYVGNNPANQIDPMGLMKTTRWPPPPLPCPCFPWPQFCEPGDCIEPRGEMCEVVIVDQYCNETRFLRLCLLEYSLRKALGLPPPLRCTPEWNAQHAPPQYPPGMGPPKCISACP